MNPYGPPRVPLITYPTSDAKFDPGSSATVSETTVELLRQTRPWVVLLSIVAFIASGLMALTGLFIAAWGMLAPGGKGSQAALGFVYIPLALVYIYPGLKLWGYGSAIERLTTSRTTVDLEEALTQQKSFWKFWGIANVVVLGFCGVGIIVLIGVGALAAAGLGKH